MIIRQQQNAILPLNLSQIKRMHPIVKEIIQLWEDKGHSMYGGEAVSQLQHALQAATLAKQAKADDALITASLLHDVGHLLHDLDDDAPDHGIDDRHEALGAGYLEKYFNEKVVQLVHLHVEAKRYLCAIEKGYFESLSEPSIQSLVLQGGLMDVKQIAAFEASPYFAEAVQLRRFDDFAKDPDMKTAELSSFALHLEHCLK